MCEIKTHQSYWVIVLGEKKYKLSHLLDQNPSKIIKQNAVVHFWTTIMITQMENMHRPNNMSISDGLLWKYKKTAQHSSTHKKGLLHKINKIKSACCDLVSALNFTNTQKSCSLTYCKLFVVAKSRHTNLLMSPSRTKKTACPHASAFTNWIPMVPQGPFDKKKKKRKEKKKAPAQILMNITFFLIQQGELWWSYNLL